MLRVRLLGELEIDLDGEPVPPPPGRRARELLGWLALHPGRHSRSELAARLWPDVLDSSARASLRTALHDLRRALGEGAEPALAATRTELGLAGPEEVWVDAAELAGLLAAGRVLDGLRLCRGEPLAGIDAEWARTWRDAHRERIARAYEQLATDADDAGDVGRALDLTRELVRLDPLSEQAHRSLMRRLAAAGDRPAALVVYARHAERLRRELGVAPSASTRMLADELRAEPWDAQQGGTGARPTAPPLPAPLARRERTALVGRVAELDRLEQLVGGQTPRPIVLVAGEPGIGKTRLAGELARRAHARGVAVLYGRCYEEALTPYQPFVEALDRFARVASAGPPPPSELARLLPALGADDRPAADAEGARWRLFEAASEYLRAAAPPAGLIVLLDDLHWADHATLLLLGHLVRGQGEEPVAFVGTYRDGELSRSHPLATTLADLRRDGLVERVVLHGLQEPDCAQMVTASLGPTPGGLVHTLHVETGGNPFYLGEVLRHVAEAAPGRPVDGIAAVGIPESVKEVIGRRLSRLPDPVNRVLRAAAVVGRTFDVDLLEELEDAGPDVTLDALDRARAAQIVREEPGRPGRFSFAHPLIRETLYEELSLTRRVRLHRAIAAALERLHGSGAGPWAGLLAGHALEAAAGGDREHAVTLALSAARTALTQLAYEEAAATCRRALEVLEDGAATDAPQRGELLLVLGDALVRGGDRGAARAAYARAAEIARAGHDPVLLAHAALGFSGPAVSIIAVDEDSVGLLEEALAGLGDDDALRARVLGRLAIETYYVSAPQRRAELGDAAVALARRGDGAALAEALNARRVALWSPAYLEERLQTAAEMVRLAQDAGDPERELQGRNWLVADLGELGRLDAMREQIAAHEELAAALRLPEYVWWGPMWRATLAILEGRFDDAEALIAELAALAAVTRDSNAELYHEIQWVALSWVRERWAEVDGALGGALDRERDRPADWAYRSGFSWAYAAMGRTDESRELLAWLAADDFARVGEDMNLLAGLCEMAHAIWLVDEPAWAPGVYRRLAPYAERNVLNGRGAAGYGCAAHSLGLLAWTAGDHAQAAAHLQLGLERNAAWGAQPWVTRGEQALRALTAGERPGGHARP